MLPATQTKTTSAFAGAVTPAGFIDFFDHIMPIKNARARYFLKGSTGAGKSTFIKKMLAILIAKGHLVEQFHCANDANSLDGIAVQKLGLSIIDATLPHSHDPKIPGAIDTIIDFGQFLTPTKLTPHLDTIKILQHQKSQLSKKASLYMKALGNIYQAEKPRELKQKGLLQDCLKILDIPILDHTTYPQGQDRKLFVTAITPDGLISFANFTGATYNLQASYGPKAKDAIPQLRAAIHTAGLNTITYHSPFAPAEIEYLHIPDKHITFALPFDTEAASPLFKSTLSATIHTMKASRNKHERLEKIFIDAMDFTKLDEALLPYFAHCH